MIYDLFMEVNFMTVEMYGDCYFSRYTDIYAMEMCCFWTDSPLFTGPALWHILHASLKERRPCDCTMPTAKLTMLILMVMKWTLIFLRMKWLAVKHIIFVCQYFHTISCNALVYLFLIVQKAVRYRLLTNGAQVWC